MRQSIGFVILFTAFFTLFQNCGEVKFTEAVSKLGTLGVCNGVSCDLTPLTTKPAVTTILIALGDESNSQLVVSGVSSQLIAETVVRYSTPKENPRILLVNDHAAGSEDPEDTRYVDEVLLGRYNVTLVSEPASGLTDDMLKDYDMVWFNNPGAPMGSMASRDALMRFAGGVVLQGDDLARGTNFDNEGLTGLRYIDNGTSVKCDGVNYAHDNNSGYQYRVNLDASRFTGISNSLLEFKYGNDIDNVQVIASNVEVLATARGADGICQEARPAIVRYLK